MSVKLEPWVLFIDMLGYRDINGGISNFELATEFIKFMRTNEEIFKKQDSPEVRDSYDNSTFNLYKYYDIQIAFISDSLIINYFPKEVDEEIVEDLRMLHSANTLFIIIQRLQTFLFKCMKEKEILLRGGISNKFCLVDGVFAVGEGLIEAYELESRVAVYPRIVLSKVITSNESFMKMFAFLSKKIYGKDTFLGKDEDDDIYYIDYLKYNICISTKDYDTFKTIAGFVIVHKELIEKKIYELERKLSAVDEVKNNKDYQLLIKVKEKLLWLKRYHNYHVTPLNSVLVIKPS